MKGGDERETGPAGGREHKIGTGPFREVSAAGDVIVVHVGLEHVREGQPPLVEDVEETSNVPLRVDHDGVIAEADDVRGIAETGRSYADDFHQGFNPFLLSLRTIVADVVVFRRRASSPNGDE